MSNNQVYDLAQTLFIQSISIYMSSLQAIAFVVFNKRGGVFQRCNHLWNWRSEQTRKQSEDDMNLMWVRESKKKKRLIKWGRLHCSRWHWLFSWKLICVYDYIKYAFNCLCDCKNTLRVRSHDKDCTKNRNVITLRFLNVFFNFVKNAVLHMTGQ